MTFWLIAIPTAAALFALVWWSSGRAKPDLRRRAGRGPHLEAGVHQARIEIHRDTSGPLP